MILVLYTALMSLLLALGFPAAWLLSLTGRRDLMKRLIPPSLPADSVPRRVWIHAASVGESLIAFSMAGRIKRKYPDTFVFVSINTVTGLNRITGMNRESDKPVVDMVSFAPFDHPLITKRFIQRFRPSVLIIVEAEIWPWLVRSAYAAGIPVVLINARMTSRAFRRYYTIRFAFKSIMSKFSLVCVQSRSHARRFHVLGVPHERIEILGNVKFDGLPDKAVYDSAVQRKTLGIPGTAYIIVAGSTRPGEEPILFRSFRRIRETFPDTILVCAPRHLNRLAEVEKMLAEEGLLYIKRSSGDSFDTARDTVLLLDTMGELIGVFACADVAFVGGSLRNFGGHNPLEPAALGVPVLFGPYMEQTGSKELLASGAALLVHDEDEFVEVVNRLFAEKELRERMSEAGPAVVSRFKGTLDRTLRMMENRHIIQGIQ